MRKFLVLPLLLALLAPATAGAATKTKKDKLGDVSRSTTRTSKFAGSVDVIRYKASYQLGFGLKPTLIVELELKNVLRYNGNGIRQLVSVGFEKDGDDARRFVYRYCNGGAIPYCDPGTGEAEFDTADDTVTVTIPVDDPPAELSEVRVGAQYLALPPGQSVFVYGSDFGPSIKHLKFP